MSWIVNDVKEQKHNFTYNQRCPKCKEPSILIDKIEERKLCEYYYDVYIFSCKNDLCRINHFEDVDLLSKSEGKIKLKKIENVFNEINEPQIGDRCVFWDDDEENHIIGWYNGKTIKGAYEVKLKDVTYVTFKNCAKIKKDAEF